MGVVSGILVYLVVWWTALFMVLPWGVRQPQNPEVGIVGAPTNPNMKIKIIATTIVSAIIWIIIQLMFYFDVVDFRELAQSTPMG